MNSEMLKERIERDGIKKSKLAECMGISPQGFYNKLNGIHDFTISEAAVLKRMLHLTNKECEMLFFCDKCSQIANKKGD